MINNGVFLLRSRPRLEKSIWDVLYAGVLWLLREPRCGRRDFLKYSRMMVRTDAEAGLCMVHYSIFCFCEFSEKLG